MHSKIQLENLIEKIKKHYKKHGMVITKRTLSFSCWVHYEKLLHIARYPKYIDEAYSRIHLLLINKDEIL